MPSVRETIDAWGFQLVSDFKAEINKAIAADGGGQTSELAGSVVHKTIRTIDGYSFTLTMNDYWDFVNKGVKGSKSSSKAPGSPYKFKGDNLKRGVMMKFVIKRHLKFSLTDGNKKRTKGLKNTQVRKAFKQRSIQKQRESMAFVIGRSVAQKGIEPHPFFDKVFNQERLNQLTEQLKPVIKQEIIFDIKKVLNVS